MHLLLSYRQCLALNKNVQTFQAIKPNDKNQKKKKKTPETKPYVFDVRIIVDPRAKQQKKKRKSDPYL